MMDLEGMVYQNERVVLHCMWAEWKAADRVLKVSLISV